MRRKTIIKRTDKQVKADILRKAIETRCEALNALILKTSHELKTGPEGNLRITHCRGTVQYYHCLPGAKKKRKYLPKNQMETIKALAQKQYDQAVMNSAVKEKELLQKYLSGSPSVLPEEIYLDLPEARRKLINPIMEPDELFLKRWKSQPYPNMATRREHPVIFNDQGTEVDSKAELAISNQFDKRNIAFLPQFPVYLKARGWVYADFKVLNLRTRREYYWEHLGMLDSAAYRKHSLPKLNAYILNGYVPGDNLILSWESEESRLDMRVIDSLIDAFLI